MESRRRSYYVNNYSQTNLNFGLRIPVALHIHLVEILDIWLGVAPSFGLGIVGKHRWNNTSYSGSTYFFWDVPIEIGIRVWIN